MTRRLELGLGKHMEVQPFILGKPRTEKKRETGNGQVLGSLHSIFTEELAARDLGNPTKTTLDVEMALHERSILRIILNGEWNETDHEVVETSFDFLFLQAENGNYRLVPADQDQEVEQRAHVLDHSAERFLHGLRDYLISQAANRN